MDKYFIWFIFYSFIGWTYETALYSLRKGHFVNSGMLYGCICPIYGLGALMCISMFAEKTSSLYIILGAGIMTCVLEFVSSWVIEKLFGARWWDYSDWPFNLNGRVSLLSGVVFGILALLAVKGFHPALAKVTESVCANRLRLTAMTFAFILIVDMIFSAFRCKRISDSENEEVKIVLKLPFELTPSLMGLKSRVSGVSDIVTERGHDIFEYIADRLREVGIIE